MNYWELRSEIAKVVPRMTQLFPKKKKVSAIKEKGRKTGYHQFNLKETAYVKQERLLNTEEVNSFAEVSLRASACPMPLNLDVWDGLLCPFQCRYCFADAFRASLYTSFFDNSKSMGFRHCNPDFYKAKLDELMAIRDKDPHDLRSDIHKAVAMGIPMRLGIRFEDFLKPEKKKGISLQLLQYLAEADYPVMINTKSDLIGHEEYVEALRTNGAGGAVHMTLITSDDALLKKLEPGAPRYVKRLEAMKNLADAGVRVVARIEPYLIFATDDPEDVERYMDDVWATGCRNITFDTYSYSANNPGIRQSFFNIGLDWDRIFRLGCDSQALGSILLDKFMDLFRERGFSCSSFDIGCAPTNNQDICCEVGDWFEAGYNWGSAVTAARFIIQRKGDPTSWQQFEAMVNERGGFLSERLREDAWKLWNNEGNAAYSVCWSAGLEAIGRDEYGLVWKYKPEEDHRLDVLRGLGIELDKE
jgi:DNA repair photolyase